MKYFSPPVYVFPYLYPPGHDMKNISRLLYHIRFNMIWTNSRHEYANHVDYIGCIRQSIAWPYSKNKLAQNMAQIFASFEKI